MHGSGKCFKSRKHPIYLNPHMGRVQVTVGQKVHAAPLGASRWNGILGVHSRGQWGFIGHLCP